MADGLLLFSFIRSNVYMRCFLYRRNAWTRFACTLWAYTWLHTWTWQESWFKTSNWYTWRIELIRAHSLFSENPFCLRLLMVFCPLHLEVPYHDVLLLKLHLRLAAAMPTPSSIGRGEPLRYSWQLVFLSFTSRSIFVRCFYWRNVWFVLGIH